MGIGVGGWKKMRGKEGEVGRGEREEEEGREGRRGGERERERLKLKNCILQRLKLRFSHKPNN